MACLFGKYHRIPWRIKGKRSVRSISKPSKTRPVYLTSIYQMFSAQPGIIPQVTGSLTHASFWATTVYVDQHSDYFYAHTMRGTSEGDTLHAKEAYKRLADTHGYRFCAYRVDNGRLSYPPYRRISGAAGSKSASV